VLSVSGPSEHLPVVHRTLELNCERLGATVHVVKRGENLMLA
jgi:hypothetical protein